MLKIKFSSAILLTASVLIFSVLIPIIQDKIDAIKETDKVYLDNIMRAEFQLTKATFIVDLSKILDILDELGAVKDNELKKVLKELKKFYSEQSDIIASNYYFLMTEPINNKEPDFNRINEIKKTVNQEPFLITPKIKEYLSNYNNKYKSELHFWKLIEMGAYSIAVILQILGVMFGLYLKDDLKDDLLKEVRALRGQVDRIPKK
jgi:hypothetical protein